LIRKLKEHIKNTMSDEGPINPKDEESPAEDAPPPMESESSSKTEPSSDEVEGGIGEETAEPAEPTDEEAAASSNVLGRGKLPPTDEKTMGMLAHLLGGVTYLLGPLVIWAIKKDESPFVNDQGKEAMNFQITVIIALVASTVAGAVPYLGACLAYALWMVVAVVNLIFAILGGLEANKGIIYRYPFALRLIS
jgi:uncharacterized Tic20 family protein